MSIVTIKGVERSFKEHKKAIKKMCEVFNLDMLCLTSNSSNGRDFFNFDYSGYVPIETMAKHAIKCNVTHESLFNWNKPKIIDKNYWIYKSDFIKIYLIWEYPFKYYWHDHPIDLKITLSNYHGYRKGLQNWNKNYFKLLKFLDKNKALKEQYIKDLESANNEIIKWRKEIKKYKQ